MIELPEELFRNISTAEAVGREQQHFTKITDYALSDGLLVYLEGAEYPQRGIVTPEMMAAMNISKRLFVQMIKVASSPVMFPVYIILLLSSKKKKIAFFEKLAEMYGDVAYKAISNFVLKEEYQPAFSKELEWFVYFFLKQVGISVKNCTMISEAISTLVQGDNAYRYRVMDIFEGTTKEKLIENPRKEINRLVGMFLSREKNSVVRQKFIMIGYIISAVLLVPSIKKAFIEALERTDLHKLKFNEVDMYWALLYKDYNCLGMSYAMRREHLGDASVPVLMV